MRFPPRQSGYEEPVCVDVQFITVQTKHASVEKVLQVNPPPLGRRVGKGVLWKVLQ